jgi:hypothetical protein
VQSPGPLKFADRHNPRPARATAGLSVPELSVLYQDWPCYPRVASDTLPNATGNAKDSPACSDPSVRGAVCYLDVTLSRAERQ